MHLPKLPREVPLKPVDPVTFAQAVERTVSKDSARLYSCISISPNFGGSVKAYAVGCNLRCGFCWSPCRSPREIASLQANQRKAAETVRKVLTPARKQYGNTVDEVLDVETSIKEISTESLEPAEVISRMISARDNNIFSGIGSFELFTEGIPPKRICYFTLSGGEPTLCREHLLGILSEFERRCDGTNFLLQTNGFLLGSDPSYLLKLEKYASFLEIRLCFKAGTPEGLEARTGAVSKVFNLPFIALEKLLDLNINFYLAAMTDPHVMPPDERDSLIARLKGICTHYNTTLVTMQSIESTEQHSPLEKHFVYLDEESYIPYFPHILAESIDASKDVFEKDELCLPHQI